eukprot:TRINITY_DN36993_c0_g1_i1.p1 TRINITY_DN36993_c0_g1~~TRINITY_DN36993_c0_g1_i1.p1  ORF type:complete len:129 (-),score=16.82 TRINITY_DN36993_c0_g1_i1:182-568(-)
MPQLEITATGANCKKLDMTAYGITDRAGWARIELGDQKHETKRVIGANGLDPIWEEVFVFDLEDPQEDKFKVSYFLVKFKLDQLLNMVLVIQLEINLNTVVWLFLVEKLIQCQDHLILVQNKKKKKMI